MGTLTEKRPDTTSGTSSMAAYGSSDQLSAEPDPGSAASIVSNMKGKSGAAGEPIRLGGDAIRRRRVSDLETSM